MGLEDELAGFTGTTRYFRHPLGVLYTEGIHFLAEKAGAYWLIDLVASYQHELAQAHFQLWEVSVSQDHTGIVTMREDDGLPTWVRQELPYTDFPIADFSFYTVDRIILLKSEY